MAADVAKRVIDLVAEQMSRPSSEVTLETTLQDLGADSLDRVELIMKFEEEFNIEVQDEDLEKLNSLQELVNYIQQLSKQNS